MVHALEVLGSRLDGVGANDNVGVQHKGTVVANTPLDAIARLELARDEIATVVLTGAAETDRDLVAFLAEAYPNLHVIAGAAEDVAERFLPAFA